MKATIIAYDRDVTQFEAYAQVDPARQALRGQHLTSLYLAGTIHNARDIDELIKFLQSSRDCFRDGNYGGSLTEEHK